MGFSSSRLRSAINKYNSAVREHNARVRRAVNQYNRFVHDYNSLVRRLNASTRTFRVTNIEWHELTVEERVRLQDEARSRQISLEIDREPDDEFE